MPHRPGNPNWETGRLIEIPWLATAFEEQVQRLGLNEQTCATSQQLEQWCKRNKDSRYIPEWLLKYWRITVDPNFSS